MPGRGPAPKDPSKRARRNADPIAQTILPSETVKPPRFPARYAKHPCRDDLHRWWRTWVDSPQATVFSSTDWQVLLDTLPLMAEFYDGDLSLAGEIRLRVSKFGATPEDRARLRMQFAQADEADRKRPEPKRSARERYAGLSVVEAS